MLQFTPDEIEQQRRKAQQLRGMGVTGALLASSQVPGAAAQAQSLQRSADSQLADYQSANQAELRDRRASEQAGLARALKEQELRQRQEQFDAEQAAPQNLGYGDRLVDPETGEVIAGAIDRPTSTRGSSGDDEGEIPTGYDAATEELKRAAALLDPNAEEQANTGFFASKVPSVRAPSVKLDQIRNQLALFEIPKYRFGALSEAEGEWLRNTVIPMDLDEEELYQWVTEKIKTYETVSDMERYVQEAEAAGEPVDQDVLDRMKAEAFPDSLKPKKTRRRGPRR